MLFHKTYLKESSLFKPENLLREARRQKKLPGGSIPKICLLDPDGDVVNYLVQHQKACLNPHWGGYHSKMYDFELKGMQIGVIGHVVGSAFAVLVAEQAFASGTELLISITSAGIINPPQSESTRYLLITESIRDEGTSYHYVSATEKCSLAGGLKQRLSILRTYKELELELGISWTTDAPYRETPSAIALAKSKKAVAVEMEAAALYAFAKARNKAVICFAHLTNSMATSGDDFEKGLENGSISSLNLVHKTLQSLGFI